MARKEHFVTAVIGAQWGDESKGKIIDYLAVQSDVVARGQGGDNAGHTVVRGDQKYALRLLPSGVIHPHTINIMGTGMMVALDTVLNERDALAQRGIQVDGRVFISEKAHLVFPFHRDIDAAQEERKGKNFIGTTKRGIGPATEDKVNRIGIRAEQLNDPEQMISSIRDLLKVKRDQYPDLRSKDSFNPDLYWDLINLYSHELSGWVRDTEGMMDDFLDDQKRILLEGAQATLLGLEQGTYPYVTSSNPTINGIAEGVGIPASLITRRIGVYKALQSRVGEGGMPTELHGELGDLLRERGDEYGTVTRRPRRVGFLDGVAARYADRRNNFTEGVLAKVDVYSDVDADVELCTAYEMPDGTRTEKFPTIDARLRQAKPLNELGSNRWTENITKIRNFYELPEGAQNFVTQFEDYLGVPIKFVGVGPDSDALIRRY